MDAYLFNNKEMHICSQCCELALYTIRLQKTKTIINLGIVGGMFKLEK